MAYLTAKNICSPNSEHISDICKGLGLLHRTVRGTTLHIFTRKKFVFSYLEMSGLPLEKKEISQVLITILCLSGNNENSVTCGGRFVKQLTIFST
jgi:hypothetical protein